METQRQAIERYKSDPRYAGLSGAKLAAEIFKEHPEWSVKSIRKQIVYSNKPVKTEKIIYSETDNEADLSGQARTLAELLEKAKVDLTIWEVASYEIKDNSWDVTMKMETGSQPKHEAKTSTNRQFFIKSKLVRRKSIFDYEKFRSELLEDVRRASQPVASFQYVKFEKDRVLLDINIFDLHFDKVAWEEESGQNYDSKICREIFFEAIGGLLNRAMVYKIEQIYFPIGNDFFNSDYSHPMPRTTAGTPQDSDLRWQKSFRAGRLLLAEAISKLQHIAPVTVPVIPGNHDTERAFYMGDSLECFFNANGNVFVDNRAAVRKYYRYGSNLIGYDHGKNIKFSLLPQLMATEQKQMWADTKYRYWKLGHLHHEQQIQTINTKEFMGVIIKFLPSLTATDHWHFEQGFVGAARSAKGMIHCHEYGLIDEFTYNL